MVDSNQQFSFFPVVEPTDHFANAADDDWSVPRSFIRRMYRWHGWEADNNAIEDRGAVVVVRVAPRNASLSADRMLPTAAPASIAALVRIGLNRAETLSLDRMPAEQRQITRLIVDAEVQGKGRQHPKWLAHKYMEVSHEIFRLKIDEAWNRAVARTQKEPDAAGIVLEPSFALRDVVDFLVSAEDEIQENLPLKGTFSPSKALVEIWIESVLALASEAGVSAVGIAVARDRVEAQQEFAKTLLSLLGAAAQRLRYRTKNSNMHITAGDSFTPSFQIQLCDRFFILPSRSSEFLTMLKEELVSALKSGTIIAGAWGAVQLGAAGDLVYVLKQKNFVVDPSFVESEEVE